MNLGNLHAIQLGVASAQQLTIVNLLENADSHNNWNV